MPKATNKKFNNMKQTTASFRITLDVGVEMSGVPSLEDALTKARAMKVKDIINIDGVEVNDESIEVYSLYQF